MTKSSAAPLATAQDTAWLERHQEQRAALLERLGRSALSTRPLRPTLLRLSLWTDQLLQKLWRWSGLEHEPVALVALGGYGRADLYPYSDVDVMLLLPSGHQAADHPSLRTGIERFISSSWDAGLEIAASVRSIDEALSLAARDVTVQTALLEARHITGLPALLDSLRGQFGQQLDAQAFITAKRQETEQRHEKYEHTPYALEPNCKESPGGLRDLQLINWMVRASGLGDNWDGLLQHGLITQHEWQQLERNQALLARIRLRLHLVAGRREDRLVFELQQGVAESFGLTHRPGPEGRIALRASERLMRRYYWAAKAVTQLSDIVLQLVEQHVAASQGRRRPRLQRLNQRFGVRAGWLEITDADLYQREPEAILETFELLAQHPQWQGLSVRTLRALYNARALMNQAWRNDRRNRQRFLSILQQPRGVTRTLRLMNQTSVLGRTLWPFRRIVGQMQHDLFHVYTVDQHTLMVVRNVRRFFYPEHAHENPLCSQLAEDWNQPWLLVVAALFHDIAKGRGGDHSTLGAQEVRRFCRQHGITGPDAQLLDFLVRDHLLMSHVAQKQDLSDPQVIDAFTQRVGSLRYLTALYLLTVADLRGTGPKVWNAWKGKLLQDLFQLARRALVQGASDVGAVLATRKQQALDLLDPGTGTGTQPQTEPALWRVLDERYFLRNDAADIAWHAHELDDLVALSRPRRPGRTTHSRVRVRPWAVGQGLQVLICTPDRRGLFASICAWFQRSDWSILDARIHTTHNHWALDSFQVVSRGPDPNLEEAARHIEQELAQTLNENPPLPAPHLGRLSARARSYPVPPEVHFRPDERSDSWLLLISCSDRTGLLYSVAHLLNTHGVSVELARISTLGERVEDAFVLRGAALRQVRRRRQIERQLLQALQAP